MTSTIKVNNIQNQCGQNIINENSNTITLGASGDTIALASGASQSGFGREGSVNWQTSSIKTGNFTAASGEGYFINSSGSITMSLPAGSAGAIVAVSDYARNFATHNFVISPNGSEKIGGISADLTLAVNGQATTLVYVDSTKGWVNVQNAEDTQTGLSFINATGGTVTCSGNCKIHTFTSPGTFCVSLLATCASNNQVSYVVVGGGGGGGDSYGGGGGAGGFREDKSPVTPYTASPLEGAGAITVTATGFPITVGAGGALETVGSDSVFSTITSAGGAMGKGNPSPSFPGDGGSGGGGGAYSPSPYSYSSFNPGGSGNVPPVSPAQGKDGGKGVKAPNGVSAGGGGGAGSVGQDVNSPSPGPNFTTAGPGGNGVATEITGSSVTRAGGGGGATEANVQGTGGPGGGGGGRHPGNSAVAGTANTGGGGGGGYSTCVGTGGSGVVIIRYKFQ
jgi:hypothetical protein